LGNSPSGNSPTVSFSNDPIAVFVVVTYTIGGNWKTEPNVSKRAKVNLPSLDRAAIYT